MFETLTTEQVKKMSDRELALSEHFYRNNLNQITIEAYERSKNITNEPLPEDEDHIFAGAINSDGDFIPKEKIAIKTRGRKRKV